jgi:Txe/YoeB family toxin of Txe-Axe toxin-antitoxin module
MRKIAFSKIAFEQFTDWQKTDRKLFLKIVSLIQETERSPFEGF